MKFKPVRSRARVAASPAPIAMPDEEMAQLSNALRMAHVGLEKLHPPARNVRRYNKRQLSALKASIERFGVVRPILVGRDDSIIAGVAIWIAAKDLGYASIPVVYADTLTAEEMRLYRIADQKLSTLGEWDAEELKLEFLELGELSFNAELNLDLDHTFFSSRERDEIVLKEKQAPGEKDETDEQAEAPKQIAISRLGDLWVIGDHHKALCANALEEQSYKVLLGDELAQMVVCDGPYNVPVRGFVSGKKDSREFAFASGEMSSDDFIAFERSVMGHLVKYSIDGSIHYHFIDWRSVYEMIAAGRAEYTEHKNVLVWVKRNASRGWYRSQYELCCVFKNGTAPHITTFAIEEGARWRSNVLTGYPSCNSFGSDRAEDLADHPTVKGTSLIADLLRDCSSLGGIVLDAFGGSGSLLQAAHLTHRRARLIEIDPLYVDVIIRRAAKRCGLMAVLAATGQTFEAVARERLGDAVVDEEDLLGLCNDDDDFADGDEVDFDGDDLGDGDFEGGEAIDD